METKGDTTLKANLSLTKAPDPRPFGPWLALRLRSARIPPSPPSHTQNQDQNKNLVFDKE